MRRFAAVLVLACTLVGGAWLGSPTPGHALVNATISLTSSPNPSVTTTTFQIVIDFEAPVSNIRFSLSRYNGGFFTGPNECTPECSYWIGGSPYWEMAEASGRVIATFVTNASPGSKDYVFHDGFATTGETAVVEKDPTIKTTLARTPTGALLPGDELQVTVTTTSNAAGMTGELWLILPAGVSAPTSLPPGVVYESGYGVHKYVTFDQSTTYAIGVVVEAPIGTELTFTGRLGEPSGWDPHGATMTLTVGAAPTPRPTATPRATKPPQATPAATASPSTEPSPTRTPDSSPAPTPTATATPLPSPSAVQPTPAPTPEPTGAPEIAPTGGLDGGVLSGLATALLAGLGALWILRRVRSSGMSRG